MSLRPRSQAGAPPPIRDLGPEPQDVIAREAAARERVLTPAPAREGAWPKREGYSRFEPAEPGSPVDVTWGEEYFQPVQYHGIRVGPFKGTTLVRPGESVADATYRLWLELNEVAMRIRDEKVQQYLLEMVEIQKQVDGGRR